jgi:acyl-CoA reductase-like NAD-dependent aldehyde dehydrogenase
MKRMLTLQSRFGLYASVYTKNIDRAMRFAKGLEAGTVGVNCTSPGKHLLTNCTGTMC